MELTRENVLAFVNRDWAGARRHKNQSMQRWVERKGPAAALRLADGLLAQVWGRARGLKARQGYADLIDMRRKLAGADTKDR